MRIFCMIPAMSGPGGAERTMSYLVNYLAERHVVTLLTLEKLDARSFFPLPNSLRQIRINKLGGRGLTRLYRVASRFFCVRREVRNAAPDVVVSFMDTMNATALISCIGLGIPVVVSERIDPGPHRIGRVKEALRDRSYGLAQTIVAQTLRIARYFPHSLQPKLRIVANPIPTPAVFANPDRPNVEGRMRIIAVGRLERQKGFDVLIEAFARIAGEYPTWDVVILGEGPERTRLEALVEGHGLKNRVHLPGIVTNVPRELAASHLMAFPSKYEGFPNALAEGLATGLPAVGLKDVSGVEDLIVDGKTGLLVDKDAEPSALSRALADLMGYGSRRADLGDAARKHVAQWAPSRVLGVWEQLLAEAAKKGGDFPHNVTPSTAA